MSQHITLAMIVRDAEAHVERCIRSALPLIESWTIIDTGSVDRTREIVEKTLAGVPGRLLESEWVGHAHNRSELLAEAADGCDYVLMLDADMEVVLDGPMPELTADSYLLTIRDRGIEYPLPLLTRAEKPFYYAGVAHSYLACREGASSGRLRELVLIDHGGGGGRPGKIERDRDLLAAEVAKNPMDSRSWFYLAQSFRDLDQIDEAIHAYRVRAMLGGWNEEVYFSLYQAGVLLCENRDAKEGMSLLLAAWQLKPNRVEALRALGNVSHNVADKIPFPADDVLFVQPSAYRAPAAPLQLAKPAGITPDKVSAVIVTRGNVDLQPILDTLPFDDVVVWDNSQREDVKILGRYQALAECKNDVVFFVDDDVIFTAYDQLLAAYEPGVIVANMDAPWVEACGYDDLVLVGAGSIADKDLFWPAIDRYLAVWPRDEFFMLETDFIVGTLIPGRKVDLGYQPREFADDPDRLYQQPGQLDKKNEARVRARAIRDEMEAAA